MDRLETTESGQLVDVFAYGDNGFEFFFVESQVYITIPHIKDNGRGLQAEINIEKPVNSPIKSNITLSLQSSQQRTKLAADLTKSHPDTLIDWDNIIEYAVSETVRRFRTPPGLLDISADPENKKVKYLLEPILPLDMPTTLFSQGGKGKSIVADYIAVLVQHGETGRGGLNLIPQPTNVLYLDWEADAEVHRRYITAIEKGLGLDHQPILYLNCEQPLSYYVSHLRQLVKEQAIGLIIIDSQMAATAGNPQGMTEAQVAGQYYNDLRSIGCTTLTIDHVSKQSMGGDMATATPYGSVVKYNRSRSQYELKQTQEPEADYIEMALLHKKFNLGKLSKPLGIRIDFINNDSGELDKIVFKACDIADNAELVKALPLKTQIRALLLDQGAMAIREIAEYLEGNEGSIKTILNRDKKLFLKIGDKWGVITTVTP